MPSWSVADTLVTAAALALTVVSLIASTKIREIIKAIFRSPLRTSNVVPAPPDLPKSARWVAYDEDKEQEPGSPVTLRVQGRDLNFNVGDTSHAWGYYSNVGTATREDTDQPSEQGEPTDDAPKPKNKDG
jgi:hypothetical protein